MSPQQGQLFSGLVMGFAQTTMIALGKILNPVTKKTETDMDLARHYIDLLEMLETKTKGNLSAEEDRLLKQVLTELRLNFVETAQAAPAAPAAPEKPAT